MVDTRKLNYNQLFKYGLNENANQTHFLKQIWYFCIYQKSKNPNPSIIRLFLHSFLFATHLSTHPTLPPFPLKYILILLGIGTMSYAPFKNF